MGPSNNGFAESRDRVLVRFPLLMAMLGLRRKVRLNWQNFSTHVTNGGEPVIVGCRHDRHDGRQDATIPV